MDNGCPISLDEEIEQFLSEPAVWTVPPNSEPFAAAAARSQEQAVAAREALLLVLKDTPAEYLPRIDARGAQVITPTFVRALLSEAREICQSNPSKTAELTQLAVDIARRLTPGPSNPEIILHSIRGQAARGHAESLSALGNHEAAFELIEEARAEFEEYGSSGGEALFEVRHAAAVLWSHGETRLYTHARLIEAAILYSISRYGDALDIWRELMNDENAPAESVAAITSNIGNCFRELGDLESAALYLSHARDLYAQTNLHVPAAQAEWSLAKLMLARGEALEAIEAFHRIMATFENLGMPTEAALVRLDMAEAMVTIEDFHAAHALTQKLVAEFSASGLRSSALIALGFLNECFDAKQATAAKVRHVRAFLMEARARETAVFAPPPGEPTTE